MTVEPTSFAHITQQRMTLDFIDKAEEKIANSGPEYTGYGIGAGRLGTDCNRRLYYDLIWASPREFIDARKHRVFRRGDYEERAMVARMKEAGMNVQEVGDDGKQHRFTLAMGWIRGKADGKVLGIPESPKTWHALEIKSLSDEDFKKVRKKGLKVGKPEHWHQLHAGMAGMELSRGMYIGINKRTEELTADRIRYDSKERQSQENRVLGLLNREDPPVRISEDPNSFTCTMCKHSKVCHFEGFARRSCRTCVSFTFTANGQGECARHGTHLNPKQQLEHCPSHCTIPSLFPGEVEEVDADGHSITFRMADGSLRKEGENSNAAD